MTSYKNVKDTIQDCKDKVPTPAYIVDEQLVQKNLDILQTIMERSGCKILLAQKAFSMFSLYPQLRNTLCGTTASGLYEARLGYEEFRKETHVFSPAYKEEEMEDLLTYCDHLIFNSISQYERFAPMAHARDRQCGLRLNPEYSTQEHALYDPCAPGSRLGVTKSNFSMERLKGIDGFHLHTLCEQNSDALERTVEAAEATFGEYFHQVKWLNLGGGHHLTRADYDVDRLVRLICRLRSTYHVDVYLEPGEAVVLNAGFLAAKVLALVENGMHIAILDTSAACHMPDVLEVPYQPKVVGATTVTALDISSYNEQNNNFFSSSNKKEENSLAKGTPYRLAGPTCLAGDIIGDYIFPKPLVEGDILIFCDMALYTMVKNNTFNGMRLPSIVLHTQDGELKTIREFGYEDFKHRLS